MVVPHHDAFAIHANAETQRRKRRQRIFIVASDAHRRGDKPEHAAFARLPLRSPHVKF